MLAVSSPFPQFFDTDGSPLHNGEVFFGVVDQNPITAPVPVYWDFAGTQPAAQPIRTLNGYAVRTGTPAPLYVDDDTSILVRNSRGVVIYYTPGITTTPLVASDYMKTVLLAPSDWQARALLGASSLVTTAFSPTLLSSGGGSATYTARYGRHLIAGGPGAGRCLFTINIQLATLGTLAAGNLSISGLPLASLNEADNKPTFAVLCNALAVGVVSPPVADMIENTNVVRLFKFAGGSTSPLTVGDLTATATLRVTGSYAIPA